LASPSLETSFALVNFLELFKGNKIGMGLELNFGPVKLLGFAGSRLGLDFWLHTIIPVT